MAMIYRTAAELERLVAIKYLKADADILRAHYELSMIAQNEKPKFGKREPEYETLHWDNDADNPVMTAEYHEDNTPNTTPIRVIELLNMIGKAQPSLAKGIASIFAKGGYVNAA
jgi:hypothetical protein